MAGMQHSAFESRSTHRGAGRRVGLGLLLTLSLVGMGVPAVAQDDGSSVTAQRQGAKKVVLSPLTSEVPAVLTGAAPEGVFDTSVLEAEDLAVAPEAIAAPSAELGVVPPAPVLEMPEIVGFDPDTSVVESRSELETVYLNEDGTRTSEVSAVPLNVETSPGVWEEPQTDLAARGNGSAAVEDHPLAPEFAEFANADPLLSTTFGEVSVDFTLEGAAASPLVSDGDSATYPEVFPGVDLKYVVTEGAVKESFVLAQAPATAPVWTWRVAVAGAELAEGSDGSIEIRNGEEVLGTIPPAVMIDSSGVEGEREPAMANATMRLARDGDSWLLSVEPGLEWLVDPKRVFPVDIDPTVGWGHNDVRSYRSDGVVVYNDGVKTGNPNIAGANAFWRSNVHYPYENVFGKQVIGTQIDGWLSTGTANSYVQKLYTTPFFGYLGASEYVTESPVDYYDYGFSGTTFTNRVSDYVNAGNSSQYFTWVGAELPGVYTYKRMNTSLWIDHVDYPVVGNVRAPAPSDGGRAGRTPVLAVSSTDASQWYFRVSTSASNFDANVVWTSSWSAWDNVQVPTNLLAPGTTYYWNVIAVGPYHGLYGTNTGRGSNTFFFTTDSYPSFDQAASTPANGSVTADLTPTLTVPTGVDPNGDSFQYMFRVGSGATCSAATTVTSGWIAGPTWTVPEGALRDGGVYSWCVQTKSSVSTSDESWSSKLTVNQRLAESGPAPVEQVGPVTVNLANGNLGVRFASPTVTTVGGSMGLSFSYNSQTATQRGLLGQYFDVTPQPGQSPSFTFAGRTPTITRVDPQLSFDWGMEAPAPSMGQDYYLARWSGYVTPPTAGNYAFGVVRDDGAKVKIGGSTVLDVWSDSAAVGPTQCRLGPRASRWSTTRTSPHRSSNSGFGTLPEPNMWSRLPG